MNKYKATWKKKQKKHYQTEQLKSIPNYLRDPSKELTFISEQENTVQMQQTPFQSRAKFNNKTRSEEIEPWQGEIKSYKIGQPITRPNTTTTVSGKIKSKTYSNGFKSTVSPFKSKQPFMNRTLKLLTCKFECNKTRESFSKPTPVINKTEIREEKCWFSNQLQAKTTNFKQKKQVLAFIEYPYIYQDKKKVSKFAYWKTLNLRRIPKNLRFTKDELYNKLKHFQSNSSSKKLLN